jgi:squalene-hopene/tetraprenyl-beta-curcumene cyclase
MLEQVVRMTNQQKLRGQLAMVSSSRLEAAYQTALAALLKERTPEGHWIGELSTSALSTATAVMALHLVGKHAMGPNRHAPLVTRGLTWLAANQNEDGAWGDTTKSHSNISTTMLCRAAFYLTGAAESNRATVNKAEAWLFNRFGNTPAQLAEAVRARYGKDRTFATPILTTCALAGLVDWKEVPPLPFELAVFPQSWFRFLRLHVVSYALPALIAIGQCIYHHKKPGNPITRLLRVVSRAKSLRVLKKIQPSSGGFLEAIPLTSFVTLSLAACGLADHEVAKKGSQFLVSAVLDDGSWAIDSNLATWVTTLSINALAAAGEIDILPKRGELLAWLFGQQHLEPHPYTGAAPGGWAWTPLPGGVPDGDDTSGVVLALANLKTLDLQTIVAGLRWLWGLQNRDGGIPTFCRGWGRLPFDRSGTDLTAHALRAVAPWYDVNGHEPPEPIIAIEVRLESLYDGGICFLNRSQRPDGSWLPLWFGNQHAHDDENPTYGTARVLAAYRDLGMMDTEAARRGVSWLLSVQNVDGGWGGAKNTPSSMEETALAVEILVDCGPEAAPALNKGLAWLVDQVESGGLYKPSPIGFYFAKLWYYEKLYPIIFTVAALGRARRHLTFSP